MVTYDQVVPLVLRFLKESPVFNSFFPVVINRDLNGRVRLVLDAKKVERQVVQSALCGALSKLHEILGPYSYPPERAVILDDNFQDILSDSHVIDDSGKVRLIERLATESNWSKIAPISPGATRVAFFSIKGGVGRSTAMASAAWSLAKQGARVLVVDLDLESPGLSSSLLPAEYRPRFGITDWLVEDLVGNGSELVDNMIATSPISHDSDIFVVPAYGADPGEYVSKLGRAWMPLVKGGRRESWSERLARLLLDLEDRLKPDIILIDSRAGIDEVASACVTDLGAALVLLFAIDGEQTWAGYKVLFDHWRTTGVAREIRDRLQVVGAMIPEEGGAGYFSLLTESSWDLFSSSLYDEVPPGQVAGEFGFSFSEADQGAPHYPWPIRWQRGFSALRSLHGKLYGVDEELVNLTYGSLISQLSLLIREDG